nr:helix-turn-helix domain-containing protein [Rhodobacter sp. SGA-6-6]
MRFETPPSLDHLRAAYLRYLLDQTRGNRREMARILGISERNLYRLLPQMSDIETKAEGAPRQEGG